MTLPIIELDQPLPLPIQHTAVTAPFWDALARGRFIANCCQACGYLAFPPKGFCPHCSAGDMGWTELSGKGVLYSCTTVHAAPAVFGELPLQVAIVDLEEGIRLVTRLLEGDQAVLDTAVELQVTKLTNGFLFAARPL